MNNNEPIVVQATHETMTESEIRVYAGSLHYTAPARYTFTPQPDITAYELALCVPIMQFGTTHETYVLELPESVRRHFVKEG